MEKIFSEDCNKMCDNCKNPKEKIEGKKYIELLIKTIEDCKERFKPKEIAKIMVGESNSLIKQHMSQIEFCLEKEKKRILIFGIQL